MEWIWKDLFRPVLPPGSGAEDGLVAMAILCNCRFELSPSAFPAESLAPLTWRGGASVVAEIWPDREAEEARPDFWYMLYPDRLPTGSPHDLPRDRYDWARHERMLAALRADPRVRAVEEE
ncbi:MAG TPA: hypothetical protein VF950_07380 [Planctomycetota bacterium]